MIPFGSILDIDYDRLHSDDEDVPCITHYINGYISHQEFYKNGKCHRENDKPAIIHMSKKGIIYHITYSLFGYEYDPKDKEYLEYKKFLRLILENESLWLTNLTNNNIFIRKHCKQYTRK